MNIKVFNRFTNAKEIDNKFDNKKEVLEKFNEQEYLHSVKPGNENKGGIPLIYEKNKVYVNSSEDHTIIFGSTGSGKSRYLIMPLICNLAKNGENIVVFDVKGELFETTSGMLKEQGYNVKVFNLKDPSKSNRFSFFHYPYHLIKDDPNNQNNIDKGEEMLKDIASSLLDQKGRNQNDPYWDNIAESLLLGCMLAMIHNATCEEECNFNNLSDLIRSTNEIIDKDDDESYKRDNWLRIYFDNLPVDSTIRQNLASTLELKAPNTLGCVVSSALKLVDLFTSSKSIQNLLSEVEIDFYDFNDPEKKTVLYVIVPDEKETYNGVFSMLIKQLYETLMYALSTSSKQKLDRRINFVLDEFANIPRISNVCTMLSASRSRNVRFFIVLQNNSQLISKYGNCDANTIKYNCQNWIFLNTKDEDILNDIVQRVGIDPLTNKEAITKRDLQLLKKEIPYVKALVFTQDTNPFVTTLLDISFYKELFNDDGSLAYSSLNITNNNINNMKLFKARDFWERCACGGEPLRR